MWTTYIYRSRYNDLYILDDWEEQTGIAYVHRSYDGKVRITQIDEPDYVYIPELARTLEC